MQANRPCWRCHVGSVCPVRAFVCRQLLRILHACDRAAQLCSRGLQVWQPARNALQQLHRWPEAAGRAAAVRWRSHPPCDELRIIATSSR